MSMPVSSLEKETVFVLDGTHGSPVRTESGIPVLSATNVKNGILDWETERYTTQQEYEAFARRLKPSQGDVLLTIVGTIGRAAVLSIDPPPVVFQRSVSVIRPNRERLDARYLYWVTQSRDFQRQLSRFTNKSSQAGVYLKKLKTAELPLPPLPEQKRIAAILDAADALRAKRRKSIEQLDSLIQATFLEMFGDPVTNPKSWEVAPLDEVCDVQVGFAFPSKKFIPAQTGRALCRGINVGVGALVWDNRMDWPEHPDSKIDKYALANGDIVLAMDRPWIADGLKVAVITDGDLPALLVQRVCRMRCHQTSSRPLVYSLLQSDAFRRHCNPTETTIPHISPVEVKAFPVLSPPLEIQSRFASLVESIEQQKARLKAHLAELDTLFASLQSRAFNGELVA